MVNYKYHTNENKITNLYFYTGDKSVDFISRFVLYKEVFRRFRTMLTKPNRKIINNRRKLGINDRV